jgi:hypothetical protein
MVRLERLDKLNNPINLQEDGNIVRGGGNGGSAACFVKVWRGESARVNVRQIGILKVTRRSSYGVLSYDHVAISTQTRNSEQNGPKYMFAHSSAVSTTCVHKVPRLV